MPDFYSIPQLAGKINTSDNTVRRYIKRFPEFFAYQVIEGVKKYPEETIKLLERIAELYKEGKTKAQIREAFVEALKLLNDRKVSE